MPALARHTHRFGHVRHRLTLDDDTLDEQSSAMESETSITVSHEDLRFREDGYLHIARGSSRVSGCHQRPGRVQLAGYPATVRRLEPRAEEDMVNDTALPIVAGVSHRQVDIGQISMHVAEAGSGPPLLLVHGWPQNWSCWRRVVPLLADRYRLIMPDLRGHGWSDAPPRGYEKEQLATDLIGLLDALQLRQVGYVGHDWGAWTGFLACLRAPERFTALLALGIIHPFQHFTAAKAAQAWRGTYQIALSTPVLSAAMLRSSPRFVASMIEAGSATPDTFSPDELAHYGRILQVPERANATVQMYRTFLLREAPRLSRYRSELLVTPTRLVIGAQDFIGSPALLDGWQTNADDMTVEVLDGVGHFIPDEAPAVVANRINALFG